LEKSCCCATARPPTAIAAPATTAATTTRSRWRLDRNVVVILAALPLALRWAGDSRRASRWRRQRWRRRILLQHLLEFRIHRCGTAAHGDLGQLVTTREFILEGMLVGQVRRNLARLTRRD